jgi:hypothetical protein
MSNTLLTPTQVTRKALQILHQKLTFVGSIDRQYDDSFAKSGAKIGDQLKIRLPNQYTVRTGKVLNVQDTPETSVTLSLTTQKGVDLNFDSVDLTTSLDDFSTRILEPAMAVLAANIEADALSMYKDVYQQVNNQTAAATFAKFLAGRKMLVDALCPAGDRSVCLNTQDNVDMVDALKGLFQDQSSLSKQYREGVLGTTAGFDFLENTLLTPFATGTEVATGSTSTLNVNGAGQTGATLTVTNGSSKTMLKGDIFTMVGCNRVHPETKADTGLAQQFVVTADLASTGTQLSISPAIVTSGATQNVTASPTTANVIKKIGVASSSYGISLAYHKNAFAFATADLVMPKGVDFSAREVFDGISMRIVRQYDINNDKFPCRLDVYYGYKTLRAQLAARISNN